MRFYLSLPCETCGESMYMSAVTGLERNGVPEINVGSVMSQLTFDCDRCGETAYTGRY
jgi:ribosomal protein L37E